MDPRPIGVFDSGLGGLSIVKQVKRLLPREQIVYFGDTARVPYGNRSRQTLLHYARQDSRFLLSHGVKMLVAACGTISTTVDETFTRSLPVPYMGVVEVTARMAAETTCSGQVGVIGTAATVRSGAFERAVTGHRPGVHVHSRPCPLFVPLVENGYVEPGNPVTTLVAKDYLSFVPEEGIDTLILGCTHFPLLKSIIGPVVGDEVKLIDPGICVAHHLRDFLEREGMESGLAFPAEDRYYVSDRTDDFEAVASLFMGDSWSGQVEQVDIDAF